MEDLLKFILEKICTKPEELKIENKEENEETIFIIHAHDDDKGRIIGKSGNTIKAIRTILRIPAKQQNKRIMIKVE
jgi:hypothetical protein